MAGPRAGRSERPADALRDRRDVRRRGAAAAADDADAVALHEPTSTRRDRLGRSGKIVSPSRPLQRQTGVGDAGTGTGQFSPRKRIASRMSSGPVEQLRPITSTPQRLERGQHGRDVGAEQHLAAVGQQRHAALDRSARPSA